MLFKKRRDLLFSSSGWLVRFKGREGSLCIETGLAPMISEDYRTVLLVYPPSECSTSAESPRKLEGPRLEEVLSRMLEGCRSARRLVEELAGSVRPQVRELAFMRPPSEEEVLYTEARNALMLCEHIFGEDLSVEVEWFRPSYINYRRSGVTWKRLKGLAKLEPGIRGLIESY
ncbi:MAG: hypothetical protein F7B18_07290 [Desulfurococcales archaeon]|nr:hypothetical protein [Desulfurococcales archaeon]